MRGLIKPIDVILHSWTVIREYGFRTWWYVLFHPGHVKTWLDTRKLWKSKHKKS